MHFFKNKACFLYLSVVIWLYKMRKVTNTMKTLISAILITSGLIMMAGSAGDCDGACMENANTIGEMILYATIGLVLFGTGAVVAISEKN